MVVLNYTYLHAFTRIYTLFLAGVHRGGAEARRGDWDWPQKTAKTKTGRGIRRRDRDSGRRGRSRSPEVEKGGRRNRRQPRMLSGQEVRSQPRHRTSGCARTRKLEKGDDAVGGTPTGGDRDGRGPPDVGKGGRRNRRQPRMVSAAWGGRTQTGGGSFGRTARE